MFNVGDLVTAQSRSYDNIQFGLGVITAIADRTAGINEPTVYAYQIHFAGCIKHGFNNSITKRWLLEQDIELVSEAKTNV
jgi:hypothetical protein